MEGIVFDSWETVLNICIKTCCAYIFMIGVLRMVGKRILTKMNAFDSIVTFALGSVLAAISLNPQIKIIDGLVAMSLLMLLQYAVTWASVRQKKIRRWLTNSPRLLIYKGEVIPKALKEERLTIEEMYMAIRKVGLCDLSQVGAAILESNGEITVFSDSEHTSLRCLAEVKKDI